MGTPPVDFVDRDRPTVVVTVPDEYCDSCGVGSKTKAFVFAELPSGKTVALCGHHGTEALPRLEQLRAKVIDQRYLIEP